MRIVVGIDASRNRSGGAKAHLIGILAGTDPRDYGIDEVHLWTYKALMDSIPDYPWLVKHTPQVLEKSLLHQLWWQYKVLPKSVREYGCGIMLNIDAGSVCFFYPSITMSQDMLSFEPGEMKRFGVSKALLRLLALKYIQAYSLKKAYGAIFLTNYAAKTIQDICGAVKRYKVIPHGVGDAFRQNHVRKMFHSKGTIQLLYVSNAALYKHQWHVINAVSQLREIGYNVSLLLVGGGSGKSQELVDRAIASADPKHEFITQEKFVPHNVIPQYLESTDMFIFASSCENMPNTLLEAMASGLPIACSDRGPMPEVLDDGGVYFNPEDPDSIANAIRKIIDDSELQEKLKERVKILSEQYSWCRCSAETWEYLRECYLSSSATVA